MSKHSKRKNSKYGGPFGRTITGTTYTYKKNGKKRHGRLKTTVLIDKTMIEEANPNIDFHDLLEKKYQKKIRSIPTHRPVTEISELNENMSPVKVIVKNCEKPLPRVGKIGPLNFYSNDPTLIPAKKLRLPKVRNKNKFIDDPVVIKINCKTDRPTDSKHFEGTITKRSLRKTAGRKRPTSANRVMGGSATEYYRATRFDKRRHPQPKEYLHLEANKFGGPMSPRNLGVGSAYTNTQMMSVENQIPDIVNTSSKIKVKLDVEAPVIPKTHIINDLIIYNVTIQKNNEVYVFPFSFHPQVENQPHESEFDYVGKLMRSTFSLFKKDKEELEEELEDFASTHPSVKYLTFYKK
jgi:hypothetical protein